MRAADALNGAAAACRWCDAAWSYALGANSRHAAASFEEHLFEGCASCGAALREARSVVAELDHAVVRRVVVPTRAAHEARLAVLRTRLMDELVPPEPAQSSLAGSATTDPPARPSIAETAAAAGSPLRPTEFPGVSVADRSDEGWQPTPAPGVEFKLLLHDLATRVGTALVRMAPDSKYPRHRHTVREECFVLSGDVTFGTRRMTKGDFQVGDAGSIHPVQSTEAGCILLITAGLDDEPV